MSILPEKQAELIAFCNTHVSVWGTAPTTIGLTAPLVANLADATADADTAMGLANDARDASKAATVTVNKEIKDLRLIAADLIRQIKAFAELQANPETVYAAAQIPMPSPPTPMPAPGAASNIVVTLESNGGVTLSWDATNAAASQGAFFNIARRLPGQTGFTNIGGAPGSTTEQRRMSFTDNTVPTSAASAGVQYIITGQRGTTLGAASATIAVVFGVGGAGAMVTGATLAIAA